MSLLRLQNISKDETSSGQAYEGAIRLPATENIFKTLVAEGKNVAFDGTNAIVKINAKSFREFKAEVYSLLRIYEAIKDI